MQARKKGGHHSKAMRMPNQSSNDKREYTNTSACKYCGKSHAPRQCAAYGKLCRMYGGPNHFASVCLGGRSLARGPAPSRPVYTVESGDTSGLFIGTVYVGEIDRSVGHANLFVSNQEVCFKLDSGADANVLPLDKYERLGSGAPLMEKNMVLTAFGNAKIRPEGEVKLRVDY